METRNWIYYLLGPSRHSQHYNIVLRDRVDWTRTVGEEAFGVTPSKWEFWVIIPPLGGAGGPY